jgi:membrane protease YdiL (CAAX protease family)
MPVGPSHSIPAQPARPWVVLVAIVGALAAAVLLAGPLHAAIKHSFGSEPEFAKVFRYLALGLIVVAIAATTRPWRDVPADVWGLAPRRGRPQGSPLRASASANGGGTTRNLRLIVAGFGLIVVLLAAVAAVHFLTGAAEWDRSPDATRKFVQRLPKYLLPAIPFALVEELFFRGWLLDRFQARVRSVLVAAALASIVFGFVHAFHAQYAPSVVPRPAGALAILRSWGEHVLDVTAFGPRFVGLSLFAFALCAARFRFGTLALGIGMHAAAYAFLPLYSALTEPVGGETTGISSTAPSADVRTWVGSKWLYDGVPGISMLALLAFVLWISRERRPQDVARPPI